MKRALWISLAALVLLGLYFGLTREQTPNKPADITTTQKTEPDESYKTVPVDTPPDPRLNRLDDGRVEFVPSLETSRRILPTKPAQDNIATVETLLSHYRFAYGENPVGVENFEITEQLLGKNPKRVIFIDADSTALRENELVDQWGTPYFFHALSGQVMEIVSAGPDTTFWTSDDIRSAASQDKP